MSGRPEPEETTGYKEGKESVRAFLLLITAAAYRTNFRLDKDHLNMIILLLHN